MVEIVHKDDPVLCPRCSKKAQKQNYPLKPMPDLPKATNTTMYLGQAYCEEHDDTFDWCYTAAS